MKRLAVAALALCTVMMWTAPAFAAGQVQLATAQEFSAALASHQGRIVVLNLWATWCAPCLKEIPDLMRLEQEFSSKGVRLVAVAMDDPADLGRVDAFRRKFFPGFHSYLRNEADMDTLVSVVDPAWNELLPTTYLIGRDGRMVRRIQGKRSFEDFRTELSALLDPD